MKMHFSFCLCDKIRYLVIVLIFIQFHETRTLRLSHKPCPLGNYFTDGCVSCWCDPGGQSVCENMIACPRQNVKCPMGRKYQDECGNDCTCYENTGAIFCKEKGPCNSIKRRNTPQAPPPPPPLPIPAPPTPNINRMDTHFNTLDFIPDTKKVTTHPTYRDDMLPAHLESENHDTFSIPSSVPIHKEDLIIEPALIIRRKSFKSGGPSSQEKKHPTTLLYLYEKQLKSMKDFKSYYKHYLNSQHGSNQNHHPQILETSTMRVKEIPQIQRHPQNQVVSLFSASTNSKPKYLLPSKSSSTNPQSVTSSRNQLEIEVPVRNFNFASQVSTPRPRQDFHYIFRNIKHNEALEPTRARSKSYSTVSTTSRPWFETSTAKTQSWSHLPQNLSLDQKPVYHDYLPPLETYTTTKSPSTSHPPKKDAHPLVTVFNVISSTPRPDFFTSVTSTPKKVSKSKIHHHKYFIGTTPRPQFITYVTPNRSTSTTTPTPAQFHSSHSRTDQETSASYPDSHVIRTELNKPIFVNHIVASRRYPEIYGSSQNQGHDLRQHLASRPHRPKQYQLFLKSEDKKPFFYSNANRVPLFVDKIAREFFRKPAIFVPKISTVRGQPQLQLNRVVYNHKEMIPKELVLEPGGVPMKVKFTPEAERDMNAEWMDAIRERDGQVKLEQSLGYRYQEGHQGHQTVTHHMFQEQRPYPSFSEHYPLPVPDPISIPPYADPSLASVSDYFGPESFSASPSPSLREDILSSPPYSSPPQDYPVLEHPPPRISEYESERPGSVVMTEHTSYHLDNPSYPGAHPTATEPEGDHYPVSVSPRPESSPEFQFPTDVMDDFDSYSTSGYFSDMLPLASEGDRHKSDNSVLTMLVDSVKKADEVGQNRPRITLQDVLAHKKGQNNDVKDPVHVRIRPELEPTFSSSTPTPSTTTPLVTTPPTTTTSRTTSTPESATTEEFNAEKILREILALDPEIGPDAVLYRENGETIPPLRELTSTTPTPTSSTTGYVPRIQSKGDFGIVPQDFDPEPRIWLSTPSPNPNRSSGTVDPPQTFDQFYQDLFRPQKKREEEVTEKLELKKPAAFLETDGVAKIFKYDEIIKTFKSGDSLEERSPDKPHIQVQFRNMDKREHENKVKLRGKSSAKRKHTRKKKTKENPEIATQKSAKLEKALEKVLSEPQVEDKSSDKPSDKNDPASSFKRELDWKANLVADICTTSPNSALCFTYKSLCLLMSS